MTISPNYYYVRPEHTSKGYISGRYGREGTYTPGEHTSRGYIPGHYRGAGAFNYTRPEHTSTGYIEGHYRAVPNAYGTSYQTVSSTSAASSPIIIGPSSPK